MENNKKKSYKIILLVLIIIVNLFVFMACDIVGLCADSFTDIPYVVGSNETASILTDDEYNFILNELTNNNIDIFQYSNNTSPIIINRFFEKGWYTYQKNGYCLGYSIYYPISNEARITVPGLSPDSIPVIDNSYEFHFIGYASTSIIIREIGNYVNTSTGDFNRLYLGSEVITGTRADNGKEFIYNSRLPVYVSSPIVYMNYTFIVMPGDGTGGGGGGGEDDPFMGDDNDTPPDSNTWGQKIFNRLGGINNNIIKTLKKLSELLNNIINKLSDLMDTITNMFNSENNFFNSIIDFTSQLLTKIDIIIAKLTDILNAIGNIHLVEVFSVDSAAVSTRIKSMLIYETVDTIKTDFTNLVNGFTPSPPDTLVIRVPLNNTMFSYVGDIVLDFGWYNAIRDKVQTFILAFFYCSFAFIVFTKLPSLISGAGSSYQKGSDSK